MGRKKEEDEAIEARRLAAEKARLEHEEVAKALAEMKAKAEEDGKHDEVEILTESITAEERRALESARRRSVEDEMDELQRLLHELSERSKEEDRQVKKAL